MKKLFSHLIFVKIIEFISFLENRPETANPVYTAVAERSAGLKVGILVLLVENGKLGPEEIRKHWGEGHMGCG